ncbi:MAG: hypothetical protein J6S28_02740, partial [Clostridia bacterium]|nr:hypothetical protein [Clostridia bacterium]
LFCYIDGILSVLFLGYVAARKRTKKIGDKEFRSLRRARRAARPPLRRLLKKAGENFLSLRSSVW